MDNEKNLNVLIEEFTNDHPVIVTELNDRLEKFNGVLKDFVYENRSEFVSDSLENTYKNIKVFSEVATSQYMTELAEVVNQLTGDSTVMNESIDNYL